MSILILLLAVVTLSIVVYRYVKHPGIRLVIEGDNVISFKADKTKNDESVLMGNSMTKQLTSEKLEADAVKTKHITSESIKCHEAKGVKLKVAKDFMTVEHDGSIESVYAQCDSKVEVHAQIGYSDSENVVSAEGMLVFGRFAT